MTAPTKGTVWQNGGASFLARIRAATGSYITQAGVSSIGCIVKDLTLDATTTIITPTITVASVVFDTLQTGAAWSIDSTGYNFKHDIAATAFPSGNHFYVVEYKFTPAAGEVFFVEYEVTSRPTYS